MPAMPFPAQMRRPIARETESIGRVGESAAVDDRGVDAQRAAVRVAPFRFQ